MNAEFSCQKISIDIVVSQYIVYSIESEKTLMNKHSDRPRNWDWGNLDAWVSLGTHLILRVS